jgi:hypothetical protein
VARGSSLYPKLSDSEVMQAFLETDRERDRLRD